MLLKPESRTITLELHEAYHTAVKQRAKASIILFISPLTVQTVYAIMIRLNSQSLLLGSFRLYEVAPCHGHRRKYPYMIWS